MVYNLLPLVLAALVRLPLATARGFQHAAPGDSKEFNFNVTWGHNDPVGIPREMFLINGQSPGPVIEVEQDEWVIVKVENNTPHNISIHFHGIEMYGTPWSDGVPGITQRPIPPQGTFTYQWQATQLGSFWYHAHYRAQIEDGLSGAISIHPKYEYQKPFKLISNSSKAVLAMELAERKVQPLLISDFTRFPSGEKWEHTLNAGLELSCYDAMTFNGKGRVECLDAGEMAKHVSEIQRANLALVPGSAITDKGCLPPPVMGVLGGSGHPMDFSKLPEGSFRGCKPTQGTREVIVAPPAAFASERWVALDIIGGTNFMKVGVSIDDHDMWVYGVDGSYVQPQKVKVIAVNSGDRYSVIVKVDKPGNFKIHANSMMVPQMLTGHAILSVDGATVKNEPERKPYVNIVGLPVSRNLTMFDPLKASPFPARAELLPEADELHVLKMFSDGATYLWVLNGSRLMPEEFEDENRPLLFQPTVPIRDNVTITTKNGTWVDLVFITAKFPFPSHPIHKHGNKLYQIGSGTGPFKWASVAEAAKEKPEWFNLKNPPRRDTFSSAPAREDVAWVAVRYHSVNPGPWMLHCHIANHMAGGMSMVLRDGPEVWPTIPEEYQID